MELFWPQDPLRNSFSLVLAGTFQELSLEVLDIHITHKEEFMCFSFLLNINEIFMLHSKQATKHLMKPILALGLWAINKLGVLSII